VHIAKPADLLCQHVTTPEGREGRQSQAQQASRLLSDSSNIEQLWSMAQCAVGNALQVTQEIINVLLNTNCTACWH
jgi:hypothetical protein